MTAPLVQESLRALQQHLGQSGMSVLRLALDNQPGVLTEQTGIQQHLDAVAVGHLAHLHQVGHRERLSADEVGGSLHTDERYVLRPVLSDALLQAGDVDIALELVV